MTLQWLHRWRRGQRTQGAPLAHPVSVGGERPLRVLFYAGALDYAGTWRGHERIIEALDRRRFDPWILYWPGDDNSRLEQVRALLGPDRVVAFARTAAKTGARRGYRPRWTDFAARVRALAPDVIHVARSGYYEWPLTERLAPLHVESNIFAFRDTRGVLDRSMAICHYAADRRGGADAVVYPPIPPPRAAESLRARLGIPPDAVVCGRIGRAANFHPIALEVFARLVAELPRLHYVIVAPCPETRAWVATHGTPNVVFVEPTSDDGVVAAFHHTIDVFLHYRADGEVCSSAMQQALGYGIPIVSHYSGVYDGQSETIADGGAVARDTDEYYRIARRLVADPEHRAAVGARARERAQAFDQASIVRRIEGLYLTWHAEAVRVR